MPAADWEVPTRESENRAPMGQHITSALLFDLGVFAGVLGLVMTAFNTLGTGRLRRYLEGAGTAEQQDEQQDRQQAEQQDPQQSEGAGR